LVVETKGTRLGNRGYQIININVLNNGFSK